ncbi:MAG: division/cell wall cluster transcriptional repressor MraZ [Desulfuromonadales bacterium]|nr:division/cell wall cluster transcriptional repressor MraZ [Desulfuromonadales bacterium]
MGFQGVYYNSIDAKGRASIPARFRELLNGDDALVVTQDRGGIVAYPVAEWARFMQNFAALPYDDEFREALYFATVTPATHCPFDKQGRIQIPQSLRENCQLDTDGERDVVIVGTDRSIQIWNKAKYAAILAEAEQRLAQTRQRRLELGL